MNTIKIKQYISTYECDLCGSHSSRCIAITSEDFPEINTILGDPHCTAMEDTDIRKATLYIFNYFNFFSKELNLFDLKNLIKEDIVNEAKINFQYNVISKKEYLNLMNNAELLIDQDLEVEQFLISTCESSDIHIEIEK